MSLRIKFLVILIALSIAGLCVSGYYSYQSYRDDKVAFVYDSLTEKTESHSRIFSAVSEDHEILLNVIVSLTDFGDESSLSSLRKFLTSEQRKITAVLADLPETPRFIAFQKADEKFKQIPWDALNAANPGLSLLGSDNGLFVVKRPVAKGFIAVVFEHPVLWQLLEAQGAQRSFFMGKNQIISRGKLPFSDADIQKLIPRISNLPGSFGLIEAGLGGEEHLVTFARIGGKDLLFLNTVPAKEVLLIKDIIFRQILSFIILTASVALLFGTFAARWLTRQLDTLTSAVEEIEAENFDVTVPVRSSDELGRLGNSFNRMTHRIHSLLDELRVYNLELEEKVKDRTRDLQELTDIQKGMLDALGQGFVIIDREYKILPIYSKISAQMFDADLQAASPGSILGVSGSDAESFRELFGMAFEGQLGLDDVFRLAPERRSNGRNEIIELGYAPVMKTGSDAPEYVLVIGTDKTAEIENLERARRENERAQMIQKIAGNRSALCRIIRDSKSMLERSAELAQSMSGQDEIHRLIHTIKGSFSYFHVTAVTKLCHDAETRLSGLLHGSPGPEDFDLILSECVGIRESIDAFLKEYDGIIGFNDKDDGVLVAKGELEKFYERLGYELPIIAADFHEAFLSPRVENFFSIYPDMVGTLSEKLGKNVRFSMTGGKVSLPEGDWSTFFGEFVHFIRNSVDHGIETPETRQHSGKDPVGTISFEFSTATTRSGRVLRIVLSDDGGGINWEKMREKDPSVTDLNSALERIKLGGLSSKDSVSEVSGRGVGVSAIYQAVLNRSGKCVFSSIPGAGFFISIELPLDLNSTLRLAA